MRKKTNLRNLKLSCYSAAVAYLLELNNLPIKELDLFKCDNLLIIKCIDEKDGIYSDIENIINTFLKDMKINLVDFKVNSLQNLEKYIDTYKAILLNIKCNLLEYSKSLKDAITEQNRHYVLADKITENGVIVKDLYVPETPITTYEGELKLDFSIRNEYKFQYLDVSKYHIKDINVRDLLVRCIEYYFNSMPDIMFKNFKDNIWNVYEKNSRYEKEKLFYEMATALSVSGTVATRKAFGCLLKSVRGINDDLIELLSNILSQYIVLRLFLLKAYLHRDINNIRMIIQKISTIQELEKSTFDKLYNILKNTI